MGEELGPSCLASRLFLFDENVTPIGRALRAVYPTQVAVSQDVPELGRGADDEIHVIPWLLERNAVWVTQDWHRYRNREQARWLHSQGVSVAWFRLSGVRALRVEGFLVVGAKAMPKLIRAYEAPGVRYYTVDANGAITELNVERLLRGRI